MQQGRDYEGTTADIRPLDRAADPADVSPARKNVVVPRSVTANCNPMMVEWARTDSGHTLETAAAKTNYSVGRLLSWERGEQKPTIAQLRTLARAYRRPLAVFFLPAAPPGFEPIRDFRRIPDAEQQRWSPALRSLIRRARGQQRVYAHLLADIGEEALELPRPPETDDPEAVGGFARGALGVGIDEQQQWRDEGTALRGWTRAVEAHGILLLYTSTARGHTVPPAEMLGFSDPDPVPIIVLNGSDQVRRRTFTLLHEFAHLLLRDTGVCDLHDRYTTPNFDATEVFCNAVAAATLMPEEFFLADVDVRQGTIDTLWSDDVLGRIARRFTTSREAVLRRLLTFNLTRDAYYREWRERYYREFEAPDDEKTRGGFADYYQMKVRELGVPYITAVLNAYERDSINTSDLARFLNIKVKSLPGVEEELLKNVTRVG